MKKIVFLGILIFVFSIGIGFCFGKIMVENNQKNYFQSDSNKIISDDQIIAETVYTEQKVKPNMEFGIKEYFDECGHFKFKYSELPKELINMTRQEVEDHYNGNYEVEQLDDKSLILSREINGMCDNHYAITFDEKNFVVIYKINTDTSYSLYKTTEINKEFLPGDDVQKLEEGIIVYGLAKVNSILEDYE